MYIVAYKLLGGLADRVANSLSFMRRIYLASGLSEPYEIYISLALFVTFFVSPLVFVISLFLHIFFLKMDFILALVASLLLFFVASMMVFTLFLYYPVYRVYSRRVSIEANLPFSVAYMAALASAGLGVERLIERSVTVETNKELRKEFTLLLKDIRLLGLDTATALTRRVDRSPSLTLALLLIGIRETYLTSGDLKNYLLYTAQRLIAEKTSRLRNIVNSLSMLAEVYTTMMVAAPLMFVVMLIIMSALGGQIFGLPPTVLIFILTFVVMPFSAMGIYIAIDGILSKV